jgi:hypothetical protein
MQTAVRVLRSCGAVAVAAAFWAALVAAGAAPARADLLHLADGRVVEGAVEKKDDGYHVRSRFGESVVPLADVKTWTREKPLDERIRERLAAVAPDDAVGRAELARWMKEMGRDEEARALADAVLELDPESAVAHEVLGHVRHQGAWRTPDEAKRAEGLEKHGDRWYTPEEWALVSDESRARAKQDEEQAKARQGASEVNEAVRLMTSPDPLVRARGKKRLESLAKEHDSKRIAELAEQVEAYVKAGDAMAAAAADPDRSMVLGELRVQWARLKRPIQEFATSLASGPFAAAPVRIQLPELEVVKVNTTVGIPAEKK